VVAGQPGYPCQESVIRHVSLGHVAYRAARDDIVQLVAERAVYPVQSIVLSCLVAVGRGRGSAAVVAVERGQALEVVSVYIPRETACLRSALVLAHEAYELGLGLRTSLF